MLLSNQALQFCSVPNQTIPKEEGPKIIPLILDFSTVPQWDLDGELVGALGRFSMVQTVFIDMDGQANSVTILVNGSGQRIIAKPNTQGYYNIMVPNPWKLSFLSTAGGNINVPVYLINTSIPGAVWPTV